MSAYLLLRGMKTLDLRVQRQNESALRIAQFLESHPAVEGVFYPGLESHAGHAIARQQMKGFGGILSFLLKENSLDAVGWFIPHLRFAHAAGNLGAVETIVAPPATSSHVECTPEERARLGIPEGWIRYSTGIEDVKDLRLGLNDGFANASGAPTDAIRLLPVPCAEAVIRVFVASLLR
jgi:cystathionine gamma-synthase